MIVVHRRDGELAATACEAPRCERCRRLEADNDRLREMIRMLAALAGEADLAENVLAATPRHGN